MATPIALTIAGSDPSGGAGIQADLKTFAARRVYGTGVIAALTAQNTRGVQAVAAVDAEFVAAQLCALLEDMPPAAVKTGMLHSAEVIDVIARQLQGRHLPLVIDPVLVSSSGARLLDASAERCLLERLLPQATLLTPNLDEAAALLGCKPATCEQQMREQARALLDTGVQAVLIKGGHLPGDQALDILLDGTDTLRFCAPKLAVKNHHGTGCTLSAAIAAELAKGETLDAAVASAKKFLSGALERADDYNLGAGSGSLHHLYEFY